MHKKQSTQIDITTNFQNKDNNSISIRNLNINFDSKILYKDFSIDFQENKITALLAPSGAGKTTLLKAISKQEQNSSFLFQNPRLLPWKTRRPSHKYFKDFCIHPPENFSPIK
jgi:ABC-type multidrug transport system ATPase subunit